jgi:hypothetical protein
LFAYSANGKRLQEMTAARHCRRAAPADRFYTRNRVFLGRLRGWRNKCFQLKPLRINTLLFWQKMARL